MKTISIEVAEEHHLAWCLGRFCALRPGALAQATPATPTVALDGTVKEDRPLPFLAWRDVELLRLDDQGRFRANVRIRNLKTNKYVSAEAAEANKTLLFRLNSVEHERNLSLSIPHRLIVIAIRRGLLRQHTTIESVMNGQERHLEDKVAALDFRILYAAKAHGLGLTEQPMKSGVLTER